MLFRKKVFVNKKCELYLTLSKKIYIRFFICCIAPATINIIVAGASAPTAIAIKYI